MLSSYSERRKSFFYAKKLTNGGGSLENKDYLSMHRMQTKKLQHNKGQKNNA